MSKSYIKNELDKFAKGLLEIIFSDDSGFEQADGTYAIYKGRAIELKSYIKKGFPNTSALADKIVKDLDWITGEHEHVGRS